MSPSKYRDRIYFAAVRLLDANGVTGDFTGDLKFYEVVDAVLEEMHERAVEAGRFNRKAPRDTQRQLDVIDRKLASIQCGSGTGETCDCLICNVRWMRAHLAASEAAVATLRTDLGTALSVGVAQHAAVATLRQALTQVEEWAPNPGYGCPQCLWCHSHDHRGHADNCLRQLALAAVPAPAAPPGETR